MIGIIVTVLLLILALIYIGEATGAVDSVKKSIGCDKRPKVCKGIDNVVKYSGADAIIKLIRSEKA
jgi:hypothetical protein